MATHADQQVLQKPSGSLVYLGLTAESGWQVFRIRFDDGSVTQVSTSLGDKRDPRYEPEAKRFVYKNSLGQVLQSPASGGSESQLAQRLSGVANFALSRGGQILFFTRPGAERFRQDIWRMDLKGNGEIRVALAAPTGMLKQVTLSPDEKQFAATHITRANEERLVVCSTTEGAEIQYLTPEMTMATTPSWLPDGRRIVFSFGKVRSAMQIAEVDVATKELKELTEPVGAEHFNPVSDRDNKFIFFEERTAESSSLLILERASGKLSKLQLPHQARQPHWFDQN